MAKFKMPDVWVLGSKVDSEFDRIIRSFNQTEAKLFYGVLETVIETVINDMLECRAGRKAKDELEGKD